MTSQVLILIASLMLALALVYLDHRIARVVRLRRDMLDIVDAIERVAERLNAKDEAAYLMCRQCALSVASIPEYLSLSVLYYSIRRPKDSNPVDVETSNHALRPFIALAKDAIAGRLTDYLFKETLLGVMGRILIWGFPSSRRRTITRQVVDRSLPDIMPRRELELRSVRGPLQTTH